jgi:G6PDH family F420-dependent oxidoreductase
VRLEMLEEAVEVIRALFTGEVVHHRGTHYRVDHARLYTLPERPVPIFMSAFGPASAGLAGRIADGFINTSHDEQLVRTFRDAGGRGKPMRAGLKVCWARTKEQGVATAHRIWPTESLPGELAQVLPTPEHFEQVVPLVSDEMVASAVPSGPDPQPYLAAIRRYAAVGFDELYLQQIGPDQDEFFTFYAKELEPLLG